MPSHLSQAAGFTKWKGFHLDLGKGLAHRALRALPWLSKLEATETEKE